MRLESIPKYFSPKSPTFSDSPRATASDSLTGTDVMAAFGMCQAQAELGLSAFMGKMGVSDADKVKAVTLLAEKGMAESVRVAPLRKLQDETRVRVVLALSVFAFLDYSRSASVRLLVIVAPAPDSLRPKYSRIKFTPLSRRRSSSKRRSGLAWRVSDLPNMKCAGS